MTLAATEHKAALDRLEAALEVNVAVLEAYRRRVPLALHLPRPQLVIANRLEENAGILPSPVATVETLYGEAYPDRALTDTEQAAQRDRDREQLLTHGAFVAALPLRVIDRPGEYLDQLAGELNWRVSPVAPRVLEVLGMPYAEAWSLNRTRLVAGLRARQLVALAADYEAYYRAGWRRFLEGSGTAASLEVVRAGAMVVRRGAEFAAARA